MGGKSKKPKPPKPTAQEKAIEKRTNIGLRRERMQTERMLKAQARGQLGAKSLLTGLKKETVLQQKDVKHSKKQKMKFANIFDKALYAFGIATSRSGRAKIFNEVKATQGAAKARQLLGSRK